MKIEHIAIWVNDLE
ncbi:hypothetical protein BTG_04560 [Bacillus thuringiensis HD-771]|uniref:Uncharacterized protein n=2 Tax=Bacillus TaxID=1386 RepID=A0A9W3J8W4_BACTU|nr:hypothetical protein BTG_04560 [Bacillus thuringiensis HD-771]